MSFWIYNEYFGRDWNQDFELEVNDGRPAFIKFEPNGRLTVGVTDYGSCCGGGSMNEQFDDLTLEQAIELGAYLTEIQARLMEKENAISD